LGSSSAELLKESKARHSGFYQVRAGRLDILSLFAYPVSMIGFKEPPTGLTPEGKLLFLGACQIAAIRANRLQPLNTQAYSAAIP
jgi:hypothetical protein